jgi:hypothetical protein
LGAFGSNFPLFNVIIVALCAVGIFYVYPREKRRYDSAMADYAATRMCQRCGQFYRAAPSPHLAYPLAK